MRKISEVLRLRFELGTGISSNGNVPFPFNFGARIDPSGTHLDIAIHYGIDGGSGDNVEWGHAPQRTDY